MVWWKCKTEFEQEINFGDVYLEDIKVTANLKKGNFFESICREKKMSLKEQPSLETGREEIKRNQNRNRNELLEKEGGKSAYFRIIETQNKIIF